MYLESSDYCSERDVEDDEDVDYPSGWAALKDQEIHICREIISHPWRIICSISDTTVFVLSVMIRDGMPKIFC
jgi:hypothetical protein